MEILTSYFPYLSLSVQPTGKWFEIQDLHVADILPQLITLSEAYIQVSLYVFLAHFLKSGPGFIKVW